MAKYTIHHTCGHTEEIQLFGKIDDREKKIAQLETQECLECQTRDCGLTGSPKQKKWALDILDNWKRKPLIYINEDWVADLFDADPETTDKVVQKGVEGSTFFNRMMDYIIENTTSAKFIIDNRTDIEDKDLIKRAFDSAIKSILNDNN